MKTLQSRFGLAVLATVLCIGANPTSLTAQDRPQGQGRGGNFDPEQFKQRMMERYREQLEVKDDDEWKLIAERVEKVMDARREVGGGAMGFMGARGGGRRGGGPDGGGAGGGAGGDARPADDQGGRGRGAPRGFGEAGPETEALQHAIESKASPEDLKAKLAKLREVRKAKEVKLEKAQEELRKLLSVRQEASAVLAGLLK